MRGLAALLAVCVAGCVSSADPCAGKPAVCLTVEVTGSAPVLDELELAVTVPGRALAGRAGERSTAGFQLPVRFAALLPADVSGALTVEVLGREGGRALVHGSAGVLVPPSGQTVRVRVGPLGGDGGAAGDLAHLGGGAEDAASANADLAGADLGSADLGSADLRSADLGSADLACAPTSCAALGATCGTRPDGCGNTLTCGAPCQLGAFSTLGTTLNPGRVSFGTAVRGDHIYVASGKISDGAGGVVRTRSVQRASLSGGALGQFTEGPTVAIARGGPTSEVIGNFLYVLGGSVSSDGTATGNIERAVINADGSLGSFADAGVSMTTPRAGHVSLVLRGYLYLFGGRDAAFYIDSVERAPINPDGTLGAFQAAGQLIEARTVPAAVATSAFVYLFGGAVAGSTTATDTIERAAIRADGSLGPFADAGVTLALGRYGHGAVVIGGRVYIVSGHDGSAELASVERASIDSAGAVGAFSTVSISPSTPRGSFGSVLTSTHYYVLGGSSPGPVLSSIERAPLQ